MTATTTCERQHHSRWSWSRIKVVDVRTLTPSRNISERLSFVWQEMTQEWKSPAGFWVWGCCTSLRLFINTHTAARRCLNLHPVRTDSQTTEVSWTDWSFGVLRQNKQLFLGPWRVKLTVFIDNVTLFLKGTCCVQSRFYRTHTKVL